MSWLRKTTRLILPAVVCLIAAQPSKAQLEPSELQALRGEYLAKVASANRSLTEQYLSALQRHERELGLSGNYEEAIEAAGRIERIRQELAVLDPGSRSAQGEGITLRARDARLSNGVTFDQSNDFLANWRNPGASATWSILRMEPGHYDVRLTYSVGRSETWFDRGRFGDFPQVRRFGGSFIFKEVNTLRPSEEVPVEFELNSTGGWETFNTVTIDRVEFTRNSANVRIEIVNPRSGQVAHIRGVELVPVAGSDNAGTLPDGSMAEAEADAGNAEPRELVQLRDSHRQRIELAAVSQIGAYNNLLSQLEQQQRAAGRDGDAAAVRNEARQPLRRVGLPPVPGTTAHGAAPRLLPGGFEALDGVRFVAHPENRVDRFHIEHEGAVYKVRLYFVTGPVQSPSVPDENLDVAGYFGIKPEAAAQLAEEGVRFLTHCLDHHDFALVTQWVPDEDGYYYVRVVLPGFGSLERTLVSRGFVMIAGRIIDSPMMPGQDYAGAVLREAERAARENRRGGWGMNEDLQDAFRDANALSRPE